MGTSASLVRRREDGVCGPGRLVVGRRAPCVRRPAVSGNGNSKVGCVPDNMRFCERADDGAG